MVETTGYSSVVPPGLEFGFCSLSGDLRPRLLFFRPSGTRVRFLFAVRGLASPAILLSSLRDSGSVFVRCPGTCVPGYSSVVPSGLGFVFCSLSGDLRPRLFFCRPFGTLIRFLFAVRGLASPAILLSSLRDSDSFL